MKNEKNLKDLGKILDFSYFEIFKNKRFLLIAGLLVFAVVSGSLLGIILFSRDDASNNDSIEDPFPASIPQDFDDAELVEVLPQQKRNDEESLESARAMLDPVRDPFAEPMKLTGVVIGGRGGTMAIIESSGTSFIVSVEDYVDDLWYVYRISRNMAVLRAHNQEVILYLDKPAETRSLERDQNH